MTNQVKVSVIMSAYNSEKFIDSAVNSIINQTYKNLELIVMDDSSSDDTYSLLQNFEKKDDRLKVFQNKKNIGLTKSLNILLQHAGGDLIARQDDDDVSNLDRIQAQVDCMGKNRLDFCTTRAITIPNNKYRPGFSHYLPKKYLIKYKNPFIHGTLMIKKSVLESVGNYDERFYYAQDYKLFNDLINKDFRYKTINRNLYKLNIKGNLSEKKKQEQEYYANCVIKNIVPEPIK